MLVGTTNNFNEKTVNNIDAGGAVLLYAFDHNSKQRFLIDTGSGVTLIPPSLVESNVRATLKPSTTQLFSADGSPIANYGQYDCELELGFSLPLAAVVRVADVQTPIIGMDFLHAHGFAVDLGAARLIRTKTNERVALEPAWGKRPQAVHAIADEQSGSKFFAKYPSVLRPIESYNAPRSPDFNLKIDVRGRGPTAIKSPRRLHPGDEGDVKKQFDEMLAAGLVRRSKSPWASPIHVVRKANGKIRVVGDYRELNAITIADKYPMKHMGDLIAKLHGKTRFTLIDMTNSFFHIAVEEDDIPKTAVLTPFGLFEYLAMSFGYKNAPAAMQRYMDTALAGLDNVYNYVDDILIATGEGEDHDAAVDALFRRLDEWGLRVNRDKCIFDQVKIQFLGHIISANGVEPISERLDAIRNYPQPKTQRELRRFLGLVNYYRRFMPHAAERLAAFSSMLRRKSKTVAWTDELTSAFDETRVEIVKTVRLTFPATGDMRILTDASGIAIAGALEQQIDGEWRPLSFYSRKLSDVEKRYSTFDRELLAIYASVLNFRSWFGSNECHVLTDHKPLTYALTKSGDRANDRQCRQLDLISQLISDIRYVKGADNVVADALSRTDEVDINTVSVVTAPSMQLHIDWARAQRDDTELAELRADDRFKWTAMRLGEEHELWCDWSTGVARAYIPPAFRRAVFDAAHNVAHPGQRGTRSAICSRYLWRGMSKNVTDWVRACDGCQRYKPARLPAAADGVFPIPAGRCRHVHLDIVGPLPSSNGKTHVLTLIDRFTRWPEAVAITSTTAPSIAKHFVDTWVTRYGCPDTITTDQGTNFTSELFAELTRLLGIHHITTTMYHPQANSIVERFHRRMKEAICSAERQRDWAAALPQILMVLRNTVKEDLGVSPAELLFGAPLSMPTDLVAPPSARQPTKPEIALFKRQMAEVTAATGRVIPPSAPTRAIESATHVYVRDDRPHGKFEPKFEGPYRVVLRFGRVYKLETAPGRFENVSILRLKPALVEPAPVQRNGVTVLHVICCGLARAKQLSHAASGTGLKSALQCHRERAAVDEATAKKTVRFAPGTKPGPTNNARRTTYRRIDKPVVDPTGPAPVVPTSGAIDRLMNMINICCELVDKILCLKVKGKKSYADIVKISSVCA